MNQLRMVLALAFPGSALIGAGSGLSAKLSAVTRGRLFYGLKR